MELFQQLNEEGVTVIMITHDAGIAAHAKQVIHLVDGQIVEEQEEPHDKEA
jgi:putative ABC transport system ATP-binding protein